MGVRLCQCQCLCLSVCMWIFGLIVVDEHMGLIK